MFSLFKKKKLPPAYSKLPVMTRMELGIFPENIRTEVVGHDFCFDWHAVSAAAEKQGCNLDDYLCIPLSRRLMAKSLKSPVTFWFAPLGKLFVVTAYSAHNVDFFDPMLRMPGYVEYGGNYLRSTARPFLHWDGKNLFRVHAIVTPPSGLFILADFGNGFGLDVSETDEDTYCEIRNNPSMYFEHTAVMQGNPSTTSTDAPLIKHVLCVSTWG